ncbi:MAG TPA: OPT/YSL family transporter, partial [Rhabdochlamydiaceae bacterium]|nr:OPT/YSL family transporter [Rhabdochlamydiaceae bacterium]
MFKPYVSAKSKMTEFTIRAVILGIFLGLIFGIGNAYLGLKVGTTVSASIPAAVLSMAILRTFFHKPSILENNLVQTIASVGEGLAAGIIFTVPALFILGEQISMMRMFMLSALGG